MHDYLLASATSSRFFDHNKGKIPFVHSKLTIIKGKAAAPQRAAPGLGAAGQQGNGWCETVADQAEARKRSWRKAGAGWEGAPTAAPPLTADPGIAVAICWEVGTYFTPN